MKEPTISLMVAFDQNYLIGNKNTIPWNIPGELKNFRTMTMNKPIIMGRKTHDSIGKILDGRINIIITRNKGFTAKGAKVFNSIKSAIKHHSDFEEIMIIGGSEIYKLAFPLASRMYITHINKSYEGDTWFPKFNLNEWRLDNSNERYEVSTATHYTNKIYTKINA